MAKVQGYLLGALMCLMAVGTAQGVEEWRVQAGLAANRLGETIEALDETLHEVYNHHSTPAFKKAIEDIHHIERLVQDLVDDLPMAPFAELCHDFSHLYEDLVAIRLDLIHLGLQSNPEVVRTWNNMANVYNNQLNPFFRNCSHHWSQGDAVLELDLL